MSALPAAAEPKKGACNTRLTVMKCQKRSIVIIIIVIIIITIIIVIIIMMQPGLYQACAKPAW